MSYIQVAKPLYEDIRALVLSARQTIARGVEILLDEQPAAIVFLNDPDERPASRTAVLRSLYGLSPMEGRVTDLLVNGPEVAEIGERLAISQQTVRFYLKAIFQKTRTNRQSALLRLALRLPEV